MMTRKSAFFSASILLWLVGPSLSHADTATYELVFESTWSAATHPTAFPNNAHYSGGYGATHNENYTLWEPGGMASPGVQRIAETGSNSLAVPEVTSAIADETAFSIVSFTGIGTPRTTTSRVSASSTHPLISFVTMIAPSPDWIVGAHDVNLIDEAGNWVPEIVIDAIPYDAGTDSGANFTSGNLATTPHEPIFRITGAPYDGENSDPLGSFTLRLTSLPGDFDGSGAVDVGDISVLCFRLGESHPLFELTGDDTIGMDDVNELVERVMGTRVGDTDLNGTVDFDDFLTLSGNFNQVSDWSGGDFNCDRNVEFADFLALSENFGFGVSDGDELAAVPEPTSLCLGLGAMLGLAAIRRRR